jgi:UDP-N-acetylenolpyruvoylglucosamine reductase
MVTLIIKISKRKRLRFTNRKSNLKRKPVNFCIKIEKKKEEDRKRRLEEAEKKRQEDELLRRKNLYNERNRGSSFKERR